jgi:hypothetical protein
MSDLRPMLRELVGPAPPAGTWRLRSSPFWVERMTIRSNRSEPLRTLLDLV